MTVRVSCPYCNTAFALPEPPPGRRAVCPRCGDTFPVKFPEGDEPGEPGDVSRRAGGHESPGGSAAVSGGPTPPDSPLRAPRSPRSARRGLILAGCLGLLGFGVGLLVAYLRGGFRTHPDPGPDAPPSAAATPPAQLAGLGLLPADCNLVLAVQPGPLLAHAARTGRDPRELLRQSGVPDSALGALDRLGLTLPQIDHLAAGTLLSDERVEIRLTLVLVLRRPPDDEDQFLRALGASGEGKKDRYKVTVANLPLTLARVSPREWVFGWSERDLEPAARGVHPPGAGHLSAGLREMLSQRLPPEAAVWAAADSGRWADKPLVRALVEQFGGKEWLPLVAKGRAAVVGLSFDDPPRLRVFVRCADAETGEQLRAYFRAKADEGTLTGGAGEWALFDTPFDPRTGLGSLRRMLDEAGR